MSWPNVTVSHQNRFNGSTREVERTLLFVGYGKKNTGNTLSVSPETDLDDVLGPDESLLKSTLTAAIANGGQNWFAYVHVLSEPKPPTPEGGDANAAWVDAVKKAQTIASAEGVVIAIDITAKDAVNRATETRALLQSAYGRFVWFMLCVAGPGRDEAWAAYVTRISAIQDGVAAPGVMVVPRLWGNEPGVLAGRLCNPSVTVADSPARVATGALVAMGNDEIPQDGKKQPLELATLRSLEGKRFSVPMWYHDFDGLYWSDGRTLDVEGGDYQVIENVRVVDKVSRRVRLRAIARLADRALNSTPGSIAASQTYFSRTLREMALATEINGVPFPGEVKPPQDGDITIVWTSSTHVQIYIVVRPYESAKAIGVSIELDTALEI
ncbi:TPA: DUF2586 family protein [Escherichia coli]|uniref:DUF2586 domain-containing protein n=1 Tax=Escherichia coli TaxID=562 RepID=UPI00192D220E|nr:DUF2586 family protein [Escherichia coli]EGB2981787.1 DUF2586 family protein [Escherichia coli]EGB6682002.1 DUF2586 family protein [Escherichia coli]MBL6334481.1 DUF2586 family protein [Escherichia coli]HDW9212481.1 DUF2586 family protein [Escherichia coli]HDW9222448.1 DUF2586 family protein [Escherichia coli]